LLSPLSDDFLTNYDWFHAYVEAEDQPVILCHTSAMECLEYFPGYGHEKEIDVFATQRGKFENVHYHIIDDLSQKEAVQFGSLTCTTVSQTANDMLDDYENMDIQAFVEGLAEYYYSNGMSWDKLIIEPRNAELFEFYREGAEDHFRCH
jgi:hypothetical protein